MKNLTKKLIGGTLLASSLLFSNYVKGQKPNIEPSTIDKHYFETHNGTKIEVWETSEEMNGVKFKMKYMYNPETNRYSSTSYKPEFTQKTPSSKKKESDFEKAMKISEGIIDAVYITSELIDLFSKKGSDPDYKAPEEKVPKEKVPKEKPNLDSWWADTSDVNWWSKENREKWWAEKYEQRKIVFGSKGDLKSGESIWDPNAEYDEETRFQGNMKTGWYVAGESVQGSKIIITVVEKGTELEEKLRKKDFWFLEQQEAKNYFAKNNWYWDDKSEFEKNKRTIAYLMVGKTPLNEVAEMSNEMDDLLQKTIEKYWWLNKE